MAEVSCSLLPNIMREFQSQWASSGSVAEFGGITASYYSDVVLSDTSITARPDALSLDYQTAFAFGPIETGSTASGSVAKAWRIQNVYNDSTFTGSAMLYRENDVGDDWRTGLTLFEYSGSGIEEIDLTFDQSARPVVSANRLEVVSEISESQIWLYRYSTGIGSFVFSEITTGKTPRVMLDAPDDVANSDITLFYVRGITSETHPGGWGAGSFLAATGSGTSGVLSSSYQEDAITMSLSSYHVSDPVISEVGIFSSQAGLDASIGITGSFNPPGVASLAATIVDPDWAGNTIAAYDYSGSLIGEQSFDYDSAPGFTTKDTQFIFAPSGTFIRTFRLGVAPSDYVGYDAIYFEPSSGTVSPGPFSSQQVYYRQQRDNYAIEYSVPLTENTFLEFVDWMFGTFSGSLGVIETGNLNGELLPTGIVSGTIVGTWSGSYTGSMLIYNTGSGISGSSSQSQCDDNINIEIHQYWINTGQPGEQGIFQSQAGAVASPQMTISFSDPYVHRVGMRCVNPNYPNYLIGFDGVGNEVDRAEFPYTFGETVGPYTWAEITASGVAGTGSSPIVTVVVDPDPVDYIAFNALLYDPILPTADCEGESGSFTGVLTGSASGNMAGFISGAMTGTMSGSRGFSQGTLVGTTSSSLVEGSDFVYDLFLEDVVKLADNRLALYVTRRDIDSGSDSFGEYTADKLESILYPQQISEDEYTASISYLTSSLYPLIDHFVYDVDSFVSGSSLIYSSSMREIVVTQSVYDVDSFISGSSLIYSASMRSIVITHTVYDVDSFVTGSALITSASVVEIIVAHTVYDKDSFVSGSAIIWSASLE